MRPPFSERSTTKPEVRKEVIRPVADTMTRKKKVREQTRVATPLIEFTGASHEVVERADDRTLTLNAGSQSYEFKVPSRGFLRNIFLDIGFSGGNLGPGVFNADAPWNVLSRVRLKDIGGRDIVAPLTGYDLFLLNLFGGYGFQTDPRVHPDSKLDVNARFGLRIPLEILHNNGYGSIPNQNAAEPYVVEVEVAASPVVFSTAPTTPPNVRIRAHAEGWAEVPAIDALGRMNATAPPLVGTLQNWSKTSNGVTAGANDELVSRVGNLLRMHILVFRDANGTGVRVPMPSELSLRWDNREIVTASDFYWRELITNRNNLQDNNGQSAIPVGVLPVQYTHDTGGHAADGTTELFVPTAPSSRIEYSFQSASIGKLEILTNDILIPAQYAGGSLATEGGGPTDYTR